MPGPARPYTERDTSQALNGAPIFLGTLVSASGGAVNNLTTATPFNQVGLGPVGSVASPINFQNTLAGKMLLLQPSTNGLILPAASVVLTIAQQSTPVLAGTAVGVAIGQGERIELLMMPNMGWLQWLPLSGAGSCFVWELV